MKKHFLVFALLMTLLVSCKEPIIRKPVNSKAEQLLFHLEKGSLYGISATNSIREADKLLLEYSLSKDSAKLQLAFDLYEIANQMHSKEFSHTTSAQNIFNSMKYKYADDITFKDIIYEKHSNDSSTVSNIIDNLH